MEMYVGSTTDQYKPLHNCCSCLETGSLRGNGLVRQIPKNLGTLLFKILLPKVQIHSLILSCSCRNFSELQEPQRSTAIQKQTCQCPVLNCPISVPFPNHSSVHKQVSFPTGCYLTYILYHLPQFQPVGLEVI